MAVIIHGRGSGSEDSLPPSPRQLADVLERVHGEVRAARLLVRQIDLRETLAGHVVSALRESLLIRVLRLRQFYYASEVRPSEIVAEHFLPGEGEWSGIRPPAPAHLSRWVDDLTDWIDDGVYVDREARVPEEAWPLASLVVSLLRTHQVFCEAIVKHHGASEVSQAWPRSTEEDMLSGSTDVPDLPDLPDLTDLSDVSDMSDPGISEARPGSH